MPQRNNQQAEALRRQMEQFFESTSDAVAFLDREYRFTYLNHHARELIAPDRDILGCILTEVFPAASAADQPYMAQYRRTMEERLPGSFEAYYPDPLNMWFSINTYPSDEGITLFFRNVTEDRQRTQELERKTAEAERQRAEIESIYRTAPIGLALFDLDDYHYLRLNDRQASFFGLTPEQIVGRTLTEMAPIPGVRELFDQVAAGEPVVNFPLEGALINDLNDYRYWTVSYFPVRNDAGDITGITAASLEITPQKRAEKALIQTEKLAVVG